MNDLCGRILDAASGCLIIECNECNMSLKRYSILGGKGEDFQVPSVRQDSIHLPGKNSFTQVLNISYVKSVEIFIIEMTLIQSLK